ncbi:terminase large subunit [Rosistilla oblonga]|uniref:Phage Terminase n=1 Tax=Rosistilla oblonga TaxID=2527990 RepID=A0A518ITT5_9BACT|nr:terminase TerL endonuclease subunit [Rosistilla oblonga]QDV56504.1 Phage Terminase [Rosistilla oblonga]
MTNPKPKRPKRAPTARVLELRSQAKRDGWLKWIRQGPGEEADERAMLGGCWFSQHRADHWLDFADKYGTLTEGAWLGQKFDLLDWQAEDTSRLFGWQKHSPEWGYPVRRFKFWYEEVPKKNGKTPLLALIGNYLFFGDSFGRQINLFTCATTRKQAERLLKHSVRQVKNAPELAAYTQIRKLEGFLSLQFGDNEWFVTSSDPDSADGVNGHCLADEVHRWRGYQFFNTLRWMLASQPEGLFAAITTAGNDPDTVCRQLHDKTLAIDAGTQTDEAFLGKIYAADPTDDPHNEATWFKANPSLGTSADAPLKLSSFRQDYETAKVDPTQWHDWLQLRLNLWQTNQDSWLGKALPFGLASWDAGELKRSESNDRDPIDCFEDFTLESLHGMPCVLGFDGATVRDTTAAVLSFVDPDQPDIVRVTPKFWLPENTAIKQQETIPYREWIADGLIKTTPGDAVDFRTILDDLIDWLEPFRCHRLYFDPNFQAEWLTQELADATGAERVGFPQTFVGYGPVIRIAETMMIRRQLRHNGHRVLTWQLGNTTARTNANGDKRPVKPPEGEKKKIDGSCAMLMSLQDVVTGDGELADYYDDHDVEVL